MTMPSSTHTMYVTISELTRRIIVFVFTLKKNVDTAKIARIQKKTQVETFALKNKVICECLQNDKLFTHALPFWDV